MNLHEGETKDKLVSENTESFSLLEILLKTVHYYYPSDDQGCLILPFTSLVTTNSPCNTYFLSNYCMTNTGCYDFLPSANSERNAN